MPAGEAAERGGAADAVLAEPARRIATGIKAGNDFAAQIEHLPGRVDADARVRVVDRRRVPGRMEGRLAILCIGVGFLKSTSTPLSTKELYRSTVWRSAAGGIGRYWYSFTILRASSSIVSALKK